jgi:hypothetical protein
MTLLAVNFKGRWRKELGLGTNLLVTILLVTLSPTDAGVQSGGGGRERSSGVATLHFIRLYLVETAVVMPVPPTNLTFVTRICRRVTMPECSPTSCRNCASSLSFHTYFSLINAQPSRFFKLPMSQPEIEPRPPTSQAVTLSKIARY